MIHPWEGPQSRGIQQTQSRGWDIPQAVHPQSRPVRQADPTLRSLRMRRRSLRQLPSSCPSLTWTPCPVPRPRSDPAPSHTHRCVWLADIIVDMREGGSPWGEGIVHWHLCTAILPRENWKGRPCWLLGVLQEWSQFTCLVGSLILHVEHPLGTHHLQSLVVTIDRETTEIDLQKYEKMSSLPSSSNIHNMYICTLMTPSPTSWFDWFHLCKSATGEFHNDGDVVPVVDCSNLGDHRVGSREHLLDYLLWSSLWSLGWPRWGTRRGSRWWGRCRGRRSRGRSPRWSWGSPGKVVASREKSSKDIGVGYGLAAQVEWQKYKLEIGSSSIE